VAKPRGNGALEKAYGTPQLIHCIVQEIETGRAGTVGALWKQVQERLPGVDFEDFRRVLLQMRASGYVETGEPQVNTFQEYLTSWRFGFRVWLLIGATVAAIAAVEFLQEGFPLLAVNWIAGTFLVLFAPGYALVWALFPTKQSMGDLSRFVLAVAMSLFLVPAVGILLNFSPIGIRPGPTAWILGSLTLGLLVLGAYREFRAST